MKRTTHCIPQAKFHLLLLVWAVTLLAVPTLTLAEEQSGESWSTNESIAGQDLGAITSALKQLYDRQPGDGTSMSFLAGTTELGGDQKKNFQELVEELEYWQFQKARDECRKLARLEAAKDTIRSATSQKSDQTSSAAAENSSGSNDTQVAARVEQLTMDSENELQAVKEVLGYDPCARRLFDDYRAYDPFEFRFSTGYEYVKVAELFENGEPLLDLLVYLDLRQPAKWRWRPQFFLHSRLTNAGETVSTLLGREPDMGADMMDPADDAMDMEEMMAEPELEEALQFELAAFFPFYQYGNHRAEITNGSLKLTKGHQLRGQLGLLLNAGTLFVDSRSDSQTRYYGGFRFAFNPEWYFDLLAGRTEDLDSERIELRGQLPVATTSENSRIYLGMIANIGLDEPADSSDEDIIRVYVKWNVDLKGFFENLTNGN